MADHRKHCTFVVNGIEHTALLDEADQERLKAKPVENKARPASNKARTSGAADN